MGVMGGMRQTKRKRKRVGRWTCGSITRTIKAGTDLLAQTLAKLAA
jgi:hypothetical protein